MGGLGREGVEKMPHWMESTGEKEEKKKKKKTTVARELCAFKSKETRGQGEKERG